MGFLIDNNGLVSVDHSVKDFGDTTVKGNPTEALTRCKEYPMKIYSIFLRRKSDVSNSGDNCPFIYGMKNKRGLYITRDSIGDLCDNIYDIMRVFFKKRISEGTCYDLIIPMPSSHKISYYLAKRLVDFFSGSELGGGFFRKALVSDVLRQIDMDGDIPHEAKMNIVNAINYSKDGANFSVGDVNTKFRKYISPIIFNGGSFEGKKILLVDDLFATGATIISAKNHIRRLGGAVKVDGFCLFSPLDGRIRR